MNLTYSTTLALEALAAGHSYGFDIMDATGLPSGTVYPLLRRLEREGCVTAHWENETTARREGRPARREYRLTAQGRALLARARARFGSSARNGVIALHPARGER